MADPGGQLGQAVVIEAEHFDALEPTQALRKPRDLVVPHIHLDQKRQAGGRHVREFGELFRF